VDDGRRRSLTNPGKTPSTRFPMKRFLTALLRSLGSVCA
jgi:hypothetical protein